jgi:aspartyl-tRNA synthetase
LPFDTSALNDLLADLISSEYYFQISTSAYLRILLSQISILTSQISSQKRTFANFYISTMLRTHTCGELTIRNLGETVTLCGWVQKSRDLGGMTFIDVRDRYGLTQLVFNTDSDESLREQARGLGREFVIRVSGTVLERASKNPKMPTGEIEIVVSDIEVLNAAKIPPFLIEDDTDGGDELRAKYRYLDLRRNPVRNNLMLRHKMAQEIRKYLDGLGFIEVDTQIDCELAFITQEDILHIFEGMTRHLFKTTKGIELQKFPRMFYADAMRLYGSDKPDIRLGMEFVEMNDLVKGKNFGLFDNAELVVGINVKGCAEYTRKQIDELTEWLKRPQIGATGMIYCRYSADGTLKSSVDKFYGEDDLTNWAAAFNAKPGDLMLILAGNTQKVRKQLGELRLEMGARLGLRNKNTFAPLWVVDFPLLEWDEESGRYHAMHHPFTSPKPEDIALLDTEPGEVRANAYDLVINGVEIGGGSIRIHDRALQSLMFKHLGFSPEEAQKQFGFLMDAFEYGAPPHGGIAFGFDRLCSIFAGLDSIRDVIAFPKNNSGRDLMIDTPSTISDAQLNELKIRTTV